MLTFIYKIKKENYFNLLYTCQIVHVIWMVDMTIDRIAWTNDKKSRALYFFWSELKLIHNLYEFNDIIIEFIINAFLVFI